MENAIRVYVENADDEPPEYIVGVDSLRRFLAPHADAVDIVVAARSRPELDALRGAQFFVGSGFDPARIQSYGRNIVLIHSLSAGIERYLPLNWLPPKAVLTNSRGVHADKGGPFGAMALLMLNERAPHYAGNQRRHLWEPALSSAIQGKTVVIYGLGSLGRAIAACIRPFGVRIIGIRRSGDPHPAADHVLKPQQLEEVLSQADFLVLSCPLTRRTRGLIGSRELGLLPRGAGILNIARAGVLSNEALVEHLKSGHISGAIIDVFDPEPLPADSPWWDAPNLFIFPHTSCDDAQGYIDKCLGIFADNVGRYLSGRPLLNVVSAVHEY